MNCRWIAWMFAALVLQGCASVSTERAKDLSSAGIAYAEAVSGVVDVAIDAAIDNDSLAQIVAAPRPPVSDEVQARRATQLEVLDVGLVRTVQLYTQLQQSLGVTRAYFVALQALAGGSQAEATGEAVQGLAERVNGVSRVLETSSTKPLISDAQVQALGGLARVVAAQVHGAKVAAALQRDAPVIGRALVLQESVLRIAASDIGSYMTTVNDQLFLTRVQGPYQKGQYGAAWADDRATYLKVRALGSRSEQVDAAARASREMQAVWRRILAGTSSPAEIAASLEEVNQLLEAVAALKAANAAD